MIHDATLLARALDVSPRFREFWNRCADTDGCWIWTRGRRALYGGMFLDGKSWYVHRLMHATCVGELHPALTLDHLCRNKLCGNPSHLEQVSRGENVLRGDTIVARYRNATHCKRGHALTADNIDNLPNTRRCSTCRRERNRRYRAERAA